ncbi:MAG: hypothetical protein IPI88_07265 [Chitinophagaceae bacterium]|nr:hypothetical protein [Chitinophagaceae bacterium]
MNENEISPFDIEAFIERNINKTAIEIYAECVKEANWVDKYPINNKTQKERYISSIVLRYGRFLSSAANAFGGFNNSFDLNDVKGCFDYLKDNNR